MCKRLVFLNIVYTGTLISELAFKDSGLTRYSQQQAKLILLVSQAKNKTGWVD